MITPQFTYFPVTSGLFGFGPGLALPTHGEPKYWRTFSPPTPYQIIGVKMNGRAEASAGTPNN
jgi:hypothetical protein